MAAPASYFVSAFAKVNLTLAVLGKRPDGYHDLASVMQTISLADTVRIMPTLTGNIICETDVRELQTPENLAYRAARLLRETAGGEILGALIELHKAIPAQGGLGGGSSDAATVLSTLNYLWKTGLSDTRLLKLGAALGSDVPFFVVGGTALIGGRGEYVTPLPDAEPLWLVLAKPPVSVSTASVFRALTPVDYAPRDLSDRLTDAIRAGEALPFELLTNSLEEHVFAAYPEVAMTRDALLVCGAPIVRMSGSGPSLYAPFRELNEASGVYRRALEHGLDVWLCHTVARSALLAAQPQELQSRLSE